MRKDVIIGGTSGLGLELARQFAAQGDEVVVTGRNGQKVDDDIRFEKLNLVGSRTTLAPYLGRFIANEVSRQPIDTLVFAAGYYQEGRVDELESHDIEQMLDVGARGLIYLMRGVLKAQGKLPELITITSTSQWTVREKEPVYNFVKAGAAHFSAAIAEDERVAKVLVVGPAGMRTDFWRNAERDDLDEMMDPTQVAQEIMALRPGDYSYRFAKILRQQPKPPRVEIEETR